MGDTCHAFSQAPITTVDGNLYPTRKHRNSDGSNGGAIQTGRCLKCERSNSADGCRWCLYKSFKYCAGPSETKVDLGTALPWDQCLEVAAAHPNCSSIAYAGGGDSKCTCIRKGHQCNLARSANGMNTYVRHCDANDAFEVA